MGSDYERMAAACNATEDEVAELRRVAESMRAQEPSLAEFLLARFTEEEDAARDAAGWGPSGRERSPGRWRREGLNSVVDSDRQLVVYGNGGPPSDGAVEHITRWDPARVLVECAAKRRIVERYQWAVEAVDSDKRRVMAGGYPIPHAAELGNRDVSALRPVVHLLALPYADHPDFREEWRP